MGQVEVASPPLCECHGVEMLWHKRADYKNGGRWRCHIKYRETYRRWYEANSEKKVEAVRQWRKANPEKKKEHDRRYREANLEKERERIRLWGEKNPEKLREYRLRRIRVGSDHVCMADSLEQAAMLKAHVQRRLSEFKAQQAHEREEMA